MVEISYILLKSQFNYGKRRNNIGPRELNHELCNREIKRLEKESRVGREELKNKLKVLAYTCGCQGNFNKHYSCPCFQVADLILAEFDRLKAENESIKNTPVAKLYLEAVADKVELSTKLHQAQARLDKISEPINKFDISVVRGAITQAYISDFPDEMEEVWNALYEVERRICDYIDSKKVK